jgi:hypothetical protein
MKNEQDKAIEALRTAAAVARTAGVSESEIHEAVRPIPPDLAGGAKVRARHDPLPPDGTPLAGQNPAMPIGGEPIRPNK